MLKVDGIEYKVHVVYPTMVNGFEIREGGNAGTAQNGREIRDIIGTAYTYEMQIEPNPLFPTDFDALFHALSAPVPSHSVALPYGQDTLEFEAAVSEGERTWYGKSNGVQRWRGLKVKFRPITPQRYDA